MCVCVCVCVSFVFGYFVDGHFIPRVFRDFLSILILNSLSLAHFSPTPLSLSLSSSLCLSLSLSLTPSLSLQVSHRRDEDKAKRNGGKVLRKAKAPHKSL